jgi:hypothetical protein
MIFLMICLDCSFQRGKYYYFCSGFFVPKKSLLLCKLWSFAHLLAILCSCEIDASTIEFFKANRDAQTLDDTMITNHKWLCETLLERLAALMMSVEEVVEVLCDFASVDNLSVEQLELFDAEDSCLLYINHVCAQSMSLGYSYLNAGNLTELVDDTRVTKHLTFVMCFLLPDNFHYKVYGYSKFYLIDIF